MWCTGCHMPAGAPGYQHSLGISSGSHVSHRSPLSSTTSVQSPFECLRCHNWPGVSWANTGGGCRSYLCHDTLEEQAKHADGQLLIAWAPWSVGENATYTGTAKPGDGFGRCDNVYCHSDGTTARTGVISPNTTPIWGTPGRLACNACHGNHTYPPPNDGMPAYSQGQPKGNVHVQHVIEEGIGCPNCHYWVTHDGTSIASPGDHAESMYGGVYSLYPNGSFKGVPISFSYTQPNTLNDGQCFNVSCHPSPATWFWRAP
jgi:predicted CxxxxCH...CXXCH cytochrome family protein